MIMIPRAAISPLSGVRIWLSTARPALASPDQQSRFDTFLQEFAERVFRDGGKIVHGFQPDAVAVLLDAVMRRQDPAERLALLVSRRFRNDENQSYKVTRTGHDVSMSVDELRASCDFQEIPQAGTLEESLGLLRDGLAAQADVLVAVGGNSWEMDRSRAGVPAELLLAVNRGIPVFALGGFGGAVGGFLTENSAILANFRNGLDESANRSLADELDPVAAAQKVLSQIRLLPLGRRETAQGQRYRILCLDGGGVRGAFTAAVLAQWEEQAKGAKIADHFDLIAGTSTGGILAIGLGLGISPQEMVNFYRTQGTKIFPELGFFDKLKQGLDAKYDAANLEACLRLAYNRDGKVKYLRDSTSRLLILSYNLRANAIKLYRTSHSPDEPGYDALEAVVVGRATSAAPTYFEAALVDGELDPHEAVDGGIWANCPAMAAVAEAVFVLKIPLDRIDVLSVGTAGLPVLLKSPDRQGLAGWALKSTDLFLNSQMDATRYYLEKLLGKYGYLRVDDPVPRVEQMDDASKVAYLVSRGVQVGSDRWADVKSRFINGIKAQPWRKL